ncbi:hypothetical protein FG379_000019 [Cryptosporidium bovis]|uniref:uncharacterized protein n=1 Tax=Cryptosporidium bovis TaxID=310047 RepID=UPI003519F83E|nr:hypothetical protein FG379_000019 [Cryptosporidium bovis]
MNQYALLKILIVCILNILNSGKFGVLCGSNIVKDVGPLVGEMFDLFLEHVEKKRKNKYKLNDYGLTEHDIVDVNEKANIFPLREDVNSSDFYFPINNESNEEQNIKGNLNIFKVTERRITFNDDKVDIFLGLVTKNKFGRNSVLVFKPLKDIYFKHYTTLTQLCSSSNINNEILVEISEYSVLHDEKGRVSNSISFKLNYELNKLLNKTFIICLSDSIESNYSIYITQLSFSDEKNKKSEINDLKEPIKNEEVYHYNINKIINSEASNRIDISRYNFYDFEKDRKVLIKNTIKKNETCGDYIILVVDKEGKTLTNGITIEFKSQLDNVCFWILTFTRDYYLGKKDNFLNEVDYLSSFVLSISKTNNIDVMLVSSINYLYNEFSNKKVKLFNSLLFKLTFLLVAMIPIVLLAYSILIIVCDLIDMLLLNYNKSFTNNKFRLYVQNLNKYRRNYKDNNKNKSIERKRMPNWYYNKKEKSQDDVEINVYEQIDLNTHYDESGNSLSDNCSGDQYKGVLNNDPLKYFDSDCSISTYTGI